MHRPYALIIRDGWGYSPSEDMNAVESSKPLNHLRYIREYPTTLIAASGEDVGLPAGYQGSSEVGHLNMGAGRVVYQNLVRITKAVSDGSLEAFPQLREAAEAVRSGANIHVFGLVQDQGVHAHTAHMAAVLRSLDGSSVPPEQVFIHAITDGRDTLPSSAREHIGNAIDLMPLQYRGRIVSVTGRFYAMDRDNRWDRVNRFYDLLVSGESGREPFADVQDAIDDAYVAGESDEFIKPRKTAAFAPVGDGDVMIFFNYRFDRAREITRAFLEDGFSGFKTRDLTDITFIAFTEYYETISSSTRARVHVLFPLLRLNDLMGEVVSREGMRQLRIAETEKFAHVTFFFNGQEDTVFPGEDHIMIPSPKVETYDKKPEMSAYEVTDKALEALDSGKYDFIVLNFANPDMVGHTGVFEAAVKACAVVDECVGRVVDKILEKDGVVFLTSDHGNAEQMADPVTGGVLTAHTTNPVWFSVISRRETLQKDSMTLSGNGRLADISPTILKVMGVEIPQAMTGNVLVREKKRGTTSL